ncbi:MAG: 3D domain-containing protein [Kiritimatiellae bacterium]|nr:3D domain-containing protein [Kiritimatiellia bacterium]
MNFYCLKCFCAAMALLLAGGCATIRPPAGARPLEKKMLITAYCKCGKCCGWERNWLGRPVYAGGPLKGKPKKVGVTASGKKAGKGTLAADLSLYPYGTIMYIPGYGYGRVEDCGSGIRGNHIELFFGSHRQALSWGRRIMKVRIWLP